MKNYDEIRQGYKPQHIKILLIAESPPPLNVGVSSSRHFYRSDHPRTGDRLFVNTVKALYKDASGQTETQIENAKEEWLRKFQSDGYYMIEALESSLPHEVTKPERQAMIRAALPRLLERVRGLASPKTKIILIKSNVFVVAAEPLRAAGFTVLNTELLDYPGQYNQRAYREKLAMLVQRT